MYVWIGSVTRRLDAVFMSVARDGRWDISIQSVRVQTSDYIAMRTPLQSSKKAVVQSLDKFLKSADSLRLVQSSANAAFNTLTPISTSI
jgi:hypothetical protein